MPPRVYTPDTPDEHGCLGLDAQSARHVVQVLRLSRGDAITVFDGSGNEWAAVIEQAGRRGVLVRTGEASRPLRESPLELTLLQGLARGPRMDLVIQKATELGVTAIAVVSTTRSVVRLDEQRGSRRLEHWQRVAISACEQSGRTRLPDISGPRPLAEVLAALPAGGLRLLLDPAGRPAPAPPGPACAAALLIGPEGGLTADERTLARAHGFTSLRLGPRTLRTETAALVALALVQYLAGDLGAGNRTDP